MTQKEYKQLSALCEKAAKEATVSYRVEAFMNCSIYAKWKIDEIEANKQKREARHAR